MAADIHSSEGRSLKHGSNVTRFSVVVVKSRPGSLNEVLLIASSSPDLVLLSVHQAYLYISVGPRSVT